VTTIPEPSYPGEATLNVNVFTPVPGQADAGLPVLVWIHGGGFFAGSPSSPWYDGRAFNRDGAVTVSLSYRLGFDGFGWIADAPTNRGLRDLIAGLEWVRDNIRAFGGDPDRVTIGGQSAGGSAVLALLASPRAGGLFSQAVAHSPADLSLGIEEAERIGREFAARAGVAPTRSGWTSLGEDAVLDLQAARMAPAPGSPPSAAEFVRGTLAGGGIGLPFVPLVGDDVLPLPIPEALAHGAGPPLLIGSVAHEFSVLSADLARAWAGMDARRALAAGGLPAGVADAYVTAHPELGSAARCIGQLVTDLSFRIPLLRCADARPDRTWVYDFRWISQVLGASVHCLDLPFAWDLLDAPGVPAVAGPHPPQGLADDMHAAWVRFIATGDPGWPAWDGRTARCFGTDAADSYAPSRLLAAVLG
jgi:para-nitrobenzyl esterase